MPSTMYDEDDEDGDDVVDVGGDGRHDAPPPGQTEGQHQQAQAANQQQDNLPDPVLRAEWDAQGRCFVALFQGKQQLEKWRGPSKEEWDALRARGTLVRSSNSPMGAAGPSGGAPVSAWSSLWETVKKNIIPVAIGGAIVVGAMAVLADEPKKKKAPAGDDDEGADDADDADDSDAGDDTGSDEAESGDVEV